MPPAKAGSAKMDDVSYIPEPYGDSMSQAGSSAEHVDLEDVEQEYHTEESDISDATDDEHDDPNMEHGRNADNIPPDAPLLPMELLKPLPSPAFSLWNGVKIPWDQMTRQQKQAQRLRTRRDAKHDWDLMSDDVKEVQRRTKRSGAFVPATARSRRTKAQDGGQMRSGRIIKGSNPQLSGRERLLDARKRLVEQKGQLMQPSKKNTKKALPKR